MAATGVLPQGHCNNRLFHFTLPSFFHISLLSHSIKNKNVVSEKNAKENILTGKVKKRNA
jgi:hypothetical protein